MRFLERCGRTVDLWSCRIGCLLASSSAAPAAGGLAVALKAALKTRGGLWFGWSGKASEESSLACRDCIVSANAGQVASGDWCEIDGRRTQVSAFPIGIDTEAFAKEARAAEQSMTVKCTLASLEGRDLIIGVDRLDYSKGLKQRIRSVLNDCSIFICHIL